MDMPEVEGMNMVEEHDHPSNYRLGEEGIPMVKVEGMNMMEEHPSNHRPEDKSTDMMEERMSNYQPEVEGIDREDIDMVEDMTMEVEVEVVEREHELIENERSLRSQGVQKITSRLQVGTPIVRHVVEWRIVKKMKIR
jgi:hypothetical protein